MIPHSPPAFAIPGCPSAGQRPNFTAGVFRALVLAMALGTLPLDAQEAAPPKNDLTQAYVEGQNALAQGNFQKAIQSMKLILAKAAPDSPLESVYYTLGAANFNAHDYPEAVRALDTFVSKYPKSNKLNDARYFLGLSHIQTKDLAAAAAAFGPLESTPYRDRVLYQLASAYKEAGDVDNAIATLKKLIGPGLNSTEAANGAMLLSGLYSQKGDFDEAFNLLKTIRQNSEMLDNVIRMNSMAIELGDSLLKAEKADEALRSYQLVQTKKEVIQLQEARIAKMQRRIEENLVALRADPSKAAEITATNNQLRAVVDQSRKQLEEFKKTPDFEGPLWLRVAQAQSGVNHKWEAATIYDELLRREAKGPEREAALFGLVVASAELNRGARAREAAQTYLKEFPENPNANTASYLLGASALQDGEYENAVDYFGTSLEKQPNSTFREQIMFLVGNAHFSLGKFDLATADYDKYLAAYPAGNFKEGATYRRSLAPLFSGNYEEAVKRLNAYLAAYPQGEFVPDAKYRLAVCKFAASDYDGALADADAWVAAFPEDTLLGEVLALKGDAYAGLEGKETEAVDAYIASAKAAQSTEVLNHSLFEAAKLLQKQGDWEKIATVFQEFVKEHPTSEVVVPAVFWLGKAKVKEGKPDEATQIVAEAIQKNIGDARLASVEQLITQLAQFTAKKKTGAAPASAPDGSVPPPVGDPFAEMANLLAADKQTSRTAKARILFAQAELARLKKNPEEQGKFLAAIAADFKPDELSPVLLATVGDYLLGKNEYDKAAPFFQTLMDTYPKSDYLDYAYNGFGEIAYARKDYPAALKAFTDAIDKAGATQKLKEVTIGQAKTQLALGHLDEAEKLFKQVASTREWRGDATAYSVYSLGQIEEQRNRLAEAIAYYQRVFVAYGRYLPWVAKSYVRSAECFTKLGKQPEALNTYREMLRNEKLSAFPEFEEARKKLEAAGNG